MSEPRIADRKPAVLNLEAGTYWWCTCGHSRNQPFCDGAHKQGTGMSPMEFKLDAPRSVALCQCKRTATPPYCDGAHRNL